MYYSYGDKYANEIEISADSVLDIMYPERVVEREKFEALNPKNKTEEIDLDDKNEEKSEGRYLEDADDDENNNKNSDL